MQKRIRPWGWGTRVLAVSACSLAAAAVVHGEDWPFHRGKGNRGVWEETGILDTFPAEGLASRVRWRVPVKWGYSGPAVADGRVFITDFTFTKRPRGIERALALDEATGRVLWMQEWEADYTGIGYERGPPVNTDG